MSKGSTSRRKFLTDSAIVLIGFPLLVRCTVHDDPDAPEAYITLEDLPGGLSDAPRIDAWLQVLADGRLRVLTGKLELGQGIRVAIMQVAAEELNIAPDRIEVNMAETGVTPNEGYTAGSRSIESSAMSVRAAAARAAEILRERAATRFGLSPEEIRLEEGQVKSRSGRESMAFAELLEGRPIEEEVTLPVRLKARESRRWVGQPVPRPGIERMVRGEAWYVQDLRFPAMVHARIVRPPGYGSSLLRTDEAGLRRTVEGVLEVVRRGSFLGVIASEEYQAIRAKRYLETHTRWSSEGDLPRWDREVDFLRGLPTDDQTVEEKGAMPDREEGETLRATYAKPYIMHGAIGPSCAVARFDGGRLEVWTHSQGIYPLRRSMAAMTGLGEEDIHIKAVPGSGCYGHNGADDAAADAAILAMAFPGRHVRLQWMREDEHGWEPYGCAMAMELEASLDDQGAIRHWRTELWSDTHSTRPGREAGSLLAAHYLEKPMPLEGAGYRGGGYRNAPPYYRIPGLRIDAHFFEGPLRVSSLRSLGAYANIFAIESFMDELADRAGADPLAFRLRHAEDERAIAVLERLREICAGESTGPNEGMGYAFSRYKNSAAYCAVAAKVYADRKTGELRIRKLWATIDAGEVINPDGLINQTEGGMIQSASWTLRERVAPGSGHVTSTDWNTYPIFTFEDIPAVQVDIIDRPDLPPLGGGEAAQGPTSAALANAVFRASGVRIRELPIEPRFRGNSS